MTSTQSIRILRIFSWKIKIISKYTVVKKTVRLIKNNHKICDAENGSVENTKYTKPKNATVAITIVIFWTSKVRLMIDVIITIFKIVWV